MSDLIFIGESGPGRSEATALNKMGFTTLPCKTRARMTRTIDHLALKVTFLTGKIDQVFLGYRPDNCCAFSKLERGVSSP